MKTKQMKRLLSMLLTAALLIGVVPYVPVAEVLDMTTTAQALDYDDTEYATPATQAELDSVSQSFAANNWGNAFYKIVSGELYVWGAQANDCLGITEYKDANGVVTPVTDKVPLPTKMPAGTFDGAVVRVAADYNGAGVVTEKNSLYVWGRTAGGMGCSDSKTPQKVDTSVVENTIDFLFVNNAGVVLRDIDGNWYIGGSNGNRMISGLLCEETHTKGSYPLTKVGQATLDAISADGVERQIAMIKLGWSTRSYLLTTDGHLFVWGQQPNYAHTNGTGDPINADNYTNGSDLTVTAEGKLRPMAGTKIEFVVADDQGNVAVDKSGDVWVWGTTHSNRFGPASLKTPNNAGAYDNTYNAYITPYKLFDHVAYNKKAIKTFLSNNVLVILCEDNTVYALGNNANQMIQPGGGDSVDTPTQVFKDLSTEHTIVGVFPTNDSMMAITKGGDMVFAGDNSKGTAGTGNTENADPGKSQVIQPTTLPPAQPLTKNEISFEVEILAGDNKGTYVAEPTDEKPDRMKKTVVVDGSAVTSYVDKLTIEAGASFRLNVYFEDFGKLHSFVVPLRFDPTRVQVVNSFGEAYASTGTTVTPSSLSNSGITQCFNNQQWKGGYLAAGGADGGYPKINNHDGWVSIMGYSTDDGAKITDKVKMFSVDFQALTTNQSATYFLFANKDNVYEFTDNAPTSDGYDASITSQDNKAKTAHWVIRNPSTEDMVSVFMFNTQPFPRFATQVYPLNSMKLEVYYGAGASITKVPADADSGDAYSGAYKGVRSINWNNSDTVYTVQSEPTPSNASFPQVTWTAELIEPLTSLATGTLEDYISITEEKDGYLKFHVAEGKNFQQTDPPAVIKFTATSKKYNTVRAEVLVLLKSYEAPYGIHISEKWVGNVVSKDEFIYHYAEGDERETENKTFNVTYINKDGAAYTPPNKEVVWKLLDETGAEIDTSDPDAKLICTPDISVIGKATVAPYWTTPGETYVTLRVESLYDATVADEVKLKVHKYVTDLEFNVEILRIATDSERELSSYLSVGPADVYESDLVWSISAVPSDTRYPANVAAEDRTPEKTPLPVTYASLGGTTGSTIYSYGWATPLFSAADGPAEYVQIEVEDMLSGAKTEIPLKVGILSLDSPIGLDKFKVRNNLGEANDVVQILDGLKAGDVLKFYKTYDDTSGPAFLTVDVVEAMVPGYNFMVPGLLSSGGGEIAVQLERDLDDGHHEYIPVPVAYTSEPSLVQGYARLLGKETDNAANTMIRVDLVGANHQETVYTGADGYFKFKEYIPPGNYTLTISKSNYLTRRLEANASTGYPGLKITAAEEFNISTFAKPIYIYPGELTADNAITMSDISYYVGNWVGQIDQNIPNFFTYDFKEDGDDAINLLDLSLVLMRKDWKIQSYPQWSIPTQ